MNRLAIINTLLEHGLNISDLDGVMWRYDNNYYKHEYIQVIKDDVIVISNQNCGYLYALFLADRYWYARIILILRSADSELAKSLASALVHLDIPNMEIRTSEDLFNGLLKDETVAWMLIGANGYSEYEIEQLLSCVPIRFVSGDLSYLNLSVHNIIRNLEARDIKYYLHTENAVLVNTSSRNNDSEVDVSVIVPTYNVEQYLAQCLDSLVTQRGVRLEILVVDDESTDKSGLIAENYSKRFSAVKVLTKKNGGCASARNYGLLHAVGKYVAFVDSDDWVDVGMYLDLFERIEESKADVAISSFRKVYEIDGKSIDEKENVLCDMGRCNGIVINKDQLFWLQPAIWRSLYKREFLMRSELDFPEQLKRFDDLYFAFLVYSKASRVIYSPYAYYNYRLGRVGQDVTANDERLYVHFLIFDLLREWIGAEGSVTDEFRLKLIEIAAHSWALKKISVKLKFSYMIRASLNFSQTVFVRLYNVPVHAKRYFGRKYVIVACAFIGLGGLLRLISMNKILGRRN